MSSLINKLQDDFLATLASMNYLATRRLNYFAQSACAIAPANAGSNRTLEGNCEVFSGPPLPADSRRDCDALANWPFERFCSPPPPRRSAFPPCARHLRMFALGVRPRNILRPSMSAGSAVPTIKPPSTEIIALRCTQQDRCMVAVYLSVSAVYKIDRSHECVLISMNRRTHVHVCISNVYN